MTDDERIAEEIAAGIADEEAAIGRCRTWSQLHPIAKSMRREIAGRVVARIRAAGFLIVPPDDGR
jgi:hypothetical protein